jgi:hypothetical protein
VVIFLLALRPATGANMLKIVAGTLLIAGSLTIGTVADAQVPARAFAIHGTKAFNACLFAAWVADYCRMHNHWFAPDYNESFRACVLANGGGKFPLDGRAGFNTEDYCRTMAHDR